jgi:hypothetical protein
MNNQSTESQNEPTNRRELDLKIPRPGMAKMRLQINYCAHAKDKRGVSRWITVLKYLQIAGQMEPRRDFSIDTGE